MYSVIESFINLEQGIHITILQFGSELGWRFSV